MDNARPQEKMINRIACRLRHALFGGTHHRRFTSENIFSLFQIIRLFLVYQLNMALDTSDWSVKILENPVFLWSRDMENGTFGGTTFASHQKDGTLLRLKMYLEEALRQVNGELSLSSAYCDTVSNVGSVPNAHIERDIPVT